MKTYEEIAGRLNIYENNLKIIKNPEGRKNVKFMISELRWVLDMGQGN